MDPSYFAIIPSSFDDVASANVGTGSDLLCSSEPSNRDGSGVGGAMLSSKFLNLLRMVSNGYPLHSGSHKMLWFRFVFA